MARAVPARGGERLPPELLRWVDGLPAGWRAASLRQLGMFFKGRGGSKEDEAPEGIPCVRYGDLYTTHRSFIRSARARIAADRAASYTPIKFGDLLFAASGETFEEIGKSAVCLMNGEVRAGGDVVVFRASVPFDPRFLGYAADSQPVAAQKAAIGTGTVIKHIDTGALKEVTIPVPPVPVQSMIADFLDRETARVDGLVTKNKQLIALLYRKRSGLIQRAVTAGLGPSSTSKDSGIPWIGSVPAHWELRRLRSTVARKQNGLWGDEPNGVADTPCVRAADFDRVRFRVDVGNAPLRKFDPDVVMQRGLRRGDLVMEGSGGGEEQPVGMVVLYDHDAVAVCSNFAARITVKRDCSARYLTYLHAALYHSRVPVRSIKQSTGIQNLDSESYFNEVVPIPPLTEQVRIADYLDGATAQIDELIAKVRRGVGLLLELHRTLTVAAVIGRLDVSSVRMGTAPDRAVL